jgi:hypothetical protein
MIALLTPTGGRERQIRLCARWMEKQTYSGKVLWVIVDDCMPRTTDFITDSFRPGWTVVKCYPSPAWKEGDNTQYRNMEAGLKVIENTGGIDTVFIIEDDDYYSSPYLEEMVKRMGNYGVVGEANTIYYNVNVPGWLRNRNDRWSSLFQTAFSPSVIPVFSRMQRFKFIDINLFRVVQNQLLFNLERPLSIGIKGQPGRAGIGGGHTGGNYILDSKYEKLRELIGDDYRYYCGMCDV